MHGFFPVALAAAAVALLPTAAGCGGKVVVDGFGDGGSGGGGGTGTTSTTSTQTSTATGPIDCADDGDCVACSACSGDGPCQGLKAACDADPDCEAFADCTSGCQDIGPIACLDQCTQLHPVGASEYLAWIDCSACGTCAVSCEVAFSFYCHG